MNSPDRDPITDVLRDMEQKRGASRVGWGLRRQQSPGELRARLTRLQALRKDPSPAEVLAARSLGLDRVPPS
jgi:hypothetical protein